MGGGEGRERVERLALKIHFRHSQSRNHLRPFGRVNTGGPQGGLVCSCSTCAFWHGPYLTAHFTRRATWLPRYIVQCRGAPAIRHSCQSPKLKSAHPNQGQPRPTKAHLPILPILSEVETGLSLQEEKKSPKLLHTHSFTHQPTYQTPRTFSLSLSLSFRRICSVRKELGLCLSCLTNPNE